MKAKYFTLFELVCPHVLAKYGERAWMFLDSRLILNLDTIRERIGKPIYVNTKSYAKGPALSEMSDSKDKIKAGELYMSAHQWERPLTSSVKDMDAEVVRLWLAKERTLLLILSG